MRSSAFIVGGAAVVLLLAGVSLRSGRHSRLSPSPSAPAAAPLDPSIAGIHLTDVAARAGLDFRWNPQPKRPLRNIDAFGYGCAFLDYDNDGFQDILLTANPVCKLYHNNGHGGFEDVSGQYGLTAYAAGWTGCAVGDYDGDGWLDILVTGYRRLLLLRNKHGKGFEDVTVKAGLDPENGGKWGSGAGFMDLDGDGTLDLVVLNYVVFGPGIKEYCELRPGVRGGCPPSVYDPEFGRLFRNNGNGTFTDVSRSASMDSTHGKALVVGFCDADEDGKIDFYLGNDGTTADFMHNTGDLKFRNVSVENGTAYGDTFGHAIAGMGVDWADYDRDGHLDFAVSAFSDESYALFHNMGRGVFTPASQAMGIAGVTYKPLGFGAKFADVDNDGWPDLLYVNGHVYDRSAEIDPSQQFREPMMIFHNRGGHSFVDIAPVLGGDCMRPMVGRGSATGDFDNDGRIDFLAVDLEGAPMLLHNESQTPNHWITVRCLGSGKNTFAYGTRLEAKAGAGKWVGQVSPASSYLSSSDPRVHFGLGDTTKLDSLTVKWASGQTEIIKNPPCDVFLTVQQGKGIVSSKRPNSPSK